MDLGSPAEDVDLIFEKFGARPPSGRAPDAGSGTWVCTYRARSCEAHGSDLTVESTPGDRNGLRL